MLLQGHSSDAVSIDTPLLAAVQLGRTQLVEQLLDAGAQIDATNGDRETALHLAAWTGHLNIVRLLIKRGAAVNGPEARV